MTRQVPRDRPLSDEDREYLHSRGYHDQVDAIDQDFPGGDTPSEVTDQSFVDDDEPDEVVDDYDEWTGAELETELRKRGLPYSGNNDARIARLRGDDEMKRQQQA